MLWLGTLVRWWGGSRQRIFTFKFKGHRRRWVDPIRTWAAVEDACPEVLTLLDLIGTRPPDVPDAVAAELKKQRLAAGKELVRISRLAFGLPEFDGTGRRPSGVTDGAAIGVLTEFVLWLADAAEDARPSPPCSGSGPDSPQGSTTDSPPASTTPAG